MGPRPGGRGENIFTLLMTLEKDASMGPRPGGRGEVLSPTGTNGQKRFNGAAPRRARRGIIGCILGANITMLQWGRAPEGAESRASVHVDERAALLQWGRAPEGAESGPRNAPSSMTSCFNGAAPRRARRGHTLPRPQPCIHGFNGAAPRRARRERNRDGKRRGGWLQWGRAPEGAERRGRARGQRHLSRFNGAAPRRARRGPRNGARS